MINLPPIFNMLPEVATASINGLPIVALESAVITHGLPPPQNLTLAQQMESEVRNLGGVPATIAVMDGNVHIGLTDVQLTTLAQAPNPNKVSLQNLASSVYQQTSGGTTVSATLFAAWKAGIQTMATGGIGGVHRSPPFDISADLPQLSRTPMVLVCAGAKAILDLHATVEYLETAGVPIIGYQTDEFPAFYSRESGLPVSARADSPEEVVALAKTHWELGMESAVLVTVPPPPGVALPRPMVEGAIQQALAEAEARGIRGQAVTPYLLGRVSELTGNASLQANLGLLRNNARVATEIALAFSQERFSQARLL